MMANVIEADPLLLASVSYICGCCIYSSIVILKDDCLDVYFSCFRPIILIMHLHNYERERSKFSKKSKRWLAIESMQQLPD